MSTDLINVLVRQSASFLKWIFFLSKNLLIKEITNLKVELQRCKSVYQIVLSISFCRAKSLFYKWLVVLYQCCWLVYDSWKEGSGSPCLTVVRSLNTVAGSGCWKRYSVTEISLIIKNIAKKNIYFSWNVSVDLDFDASLDISLFWSSSSYSSSSSSSSSISILSKSLTFHIHYERYHLFIVITVIIISTVLFIFIFFIIQNFIKLFCGTMISKLNDFNGHYLCLPIYMYLVWHISLLSYSRQVL